MPQLYTDDGGFPDWKRHIEQVLHTVQRFPAHVRSGFGVFTRNGRQRGDDDVGSARRTGSDPDPPTGLSASQREQHLSILHKAISTRKRFGKLSRAREDASVRRAEAVRDRETFQRTLAHFESLLELLLDDLRHPECKDGARLEDQIGSIQEQVQYLQRGGAQLRQHDDEWFNLANSLNDKDEQFVESAAAFAQLLQSTAVDATDPSPRSQSLKSERPSSPVPSILDRYLNRRSDIAIFRERLFDLDVEYLDFQQQRELQQDQNLTPQGTSYEEEYRTERAAILQDLDQAEDDTAQLEAQCKVRGLNTSLESRESESVELIQGSPTGAEWVFVNNWREHVPSLTSTD